MALTDVWDSSFTPYTTYNQQQAMQADLVRQQCAMQMAGASYSHPDLGYMAGQSGAETFCSEHMDSNTITNSTSSELRLNNEIKDNTIEPQLEKSDEFTRLSNHSFHELLAKFEALTKNI